MSQTDSTPKRELRELANLTGDSKCKVIAYVGIGAWLVRKTTFLCSCPHVGDSITVGEDDEVECQAVLIGPDHITVRETRKFTRPEQLESYVERGWKRLDK